MNKEDYAPLARMCAIAYRTPDFSCDDGTQGIIRLHEGFTTIVIAGTQADWRDIKKDLRAYPWRAYKTFVHRGFLLGAKTALGNQKVIDALSSARKVMLVGHSLGGGIVEVMAKDMLANGFSAPVMVTFGAPRSMFKPPVVASGSVRYVNGNDCVPTHPWPLWGYRHGMEETCIGDQAAKIFRDRYDDHHIDEYLKSLMG